MSQTDNDAPIAAAAPHKQQTKTCYIVSDEQWQRETTTEALALRLALVDIAGRMMSLYFIIPAENAVCSTKGDGQEITRQMPPFSNFIYNILEQTRLPLQTFVLSLLYICRIKQFNPGTVGAAGSEHRLMVAALMLASKYQYDDSYNNKTWGMVSQGVFDLRQVNIMEWEFLLFVKFRVHVSAGEWTTFTKFIESHLIPYIQRQRTALPNLSSQTFLDYVAPTGSRKGLAGAEETAPTVHTPSNNKSRRSMKPLAVVSRQDSAVGDEHFTIGRQRSISTELAQNPNNVEEIISDSFCEPINTTTTTINKIATSHTNVSRSAMSVDVCETNISRESSQSIATDIWCMPFDLSTPIEEQQRHLTRQEQNHPNKARLVSLNQSTYDYAQMARYQHQAIIKANNYIGSVTHPYHHQYLRTPTPMCGTRWTNGVHVPPINSGFCKQPFTHSLLPLTTHTYPTSIPSVRPRWTSTEYHTSSTGLHSFSQQHN